jgi:mannose-1-phosphate guanylyltransferase
MKNNYCVIMAGGIGSRFWPMSTPERPKQFLDVLGMGKSLLQLTYDRLKHVVPKENIFIVTNANYVDLVAEQIPEMSIEQILAEPMRKNTAPCIAYAAAKIHDLNPNANLIVAPSDHLILKDQLFLETIEAAISKAELGKLVTLGIQPSRPDTGYGYIEVDASQNVQAGEATAVIQFREKPDLATAESFLVRGNFFWNSGIFIWKTQSILDALEAFQPELHTIFTSEMKKYNTVEEQGMVNKCFSECEDISIDFAVMEQAKNVDVVIATFDWSDLGTWGSLYTHMEQDENGNAVVGENVTMIDSRNCIVNVPDNKLVMIQGLENQIIIEADGNLMILSQKDEQDLKKFLPKVQSKSPDFF